MDSSADRPRAVVAVQPVQVSDASLPVRGARLALGAALNAIALLDRSEGAGPSRRSDAVDIGIGFATLAYGTGRAVASSLRRVAAPVAHVALHPPLLDPRFSPAAVVEGARARGELARAHATYDFETTVDEAAPLLAQSVMARIDVTDVVLRTVDLQRIVNAVLDDLDLTELVLQRVDLTAVVQAVLEQLDLTQIVLDHVDIDRIVAAVDLDAAVSQVDLVGIAEYVVDAIDLPGIIRTSTGSVATEVVRGARIRSSDADATAQRIVDRVLLRRKGRRTQAPADPDESTESATSAGAP